LKKCLKDQNPLHQAEKMKTKRERERERERETSGHKPNLKIIKASENYMYLDYQYYVQFMIIVILRNR